MNFDSLLAVFPMMAQATPPPGGGMGQMMGMIVPMLLIFGIFYFMLIRPQQRKEKERQAMVDAVKTGDKVLFSGGILGYVTNVKDKILVVKVAEGVKIEVFRAAVSQVLEKGDKPEELNK